MHINVIATRSGKAQPDAVPDTKEAADAADSNIQTDTDAVADSHTDTDAETGTETHSDLCMCIKIRSMPLFLLYLVHS